MTQITGVVKVEVGWEVDFPDLVSALIAPRKLAMTLAIYRCARMQGRLGN